MPGNRCGVRLSAEEPERNAYTAVPARGRAPPKGSLDRDVLAGNMGFTPLHPWRNKSVCESCWPKVGSF